MKKFLVVAITLLFIPHIPANESRTVIMAYDGNPFYSLLATPLSFHYGMLPLILFNDGITKQHQRFFNMYGADNFIAIGKHLSIASREFTGDPVNVSFRIAPLFNSNKVVILPYNNYTLSLVATPIACYLDAPILIYRNNSDEIREFCKEKHVQKIIVVGNISIGENETILPDERSIYEYVKSLREIQYLAIANPSDISDNVLNRTVKEMHGHISNIQFILFAIKINLFGTDNINFNLNVTDDINHIEIYVNTTPATVVYTSLYDYNGKLVAYSNSFAYEEGKCYVGALSVHHPGQYRLNIKLYNGFLSGFFSQRGISIVDSDVDIRIIMEKLSSPHLPLLHISKIAPWLACAHNGMVIALEKDISAAYANTAGGPWVDKSLQSRVNDIVNESVKKIKNVSIGTDAKWLAIVGDPNMIPMYYYNGSNEDAFVGYGIPSDNPYYLNFTLGVGRIVAYDDMDASLMIARSIFYEKIAHGRWLKKFNFIFGEGFGETAGILHQIPYSKVVRRRGFDVSIYGDLRNDRSSLEKYDAFNASYIEYEGHGDWFWMFANIYTNYMNNVDSSHLRNYEIAPGIILTAACLMGRIDGVPLNGNIGLSFIHAGAIAFVGATRETGKEAKLDWIENSLLFNDTTMGEAMLISKLKEEMPTKAARVLFGDPAFNPYEPSAL